MNKYRVSKKYTLWTVIEAESPEAAIFTMQCMNINEIFEDESSWVGTSSDDLAEAVLIDE